MSTSTRLTVAACTLAVLLPATACGGSGDAGNAPVAWNEADACGLLTQDEVAGFLGGRPPEPRATEEAGDPACTWQTSGNRVKLTLYQLPEGGRALFEQRGMRVIDVAGKTTYVAASTTASCTLQIDGGQAFIALDVSSPEPAASPEARCDQVAAAGSTVIERLGW